MATLTAEQLAFGPVGVIAPAYDVDLYGDTVLLDPYPHYKALREAGAAVWLPRHEMWAIARYQDVQAALAEPDVFASGHGVAANPEMNGISTGNTLASDGALHDTLRGIVMAPLRPVELNAIRPRIEAEAEHLVEGLVNRVSFDAVSDLARHLPLTIVSDLVGLPEAGRSRMLEWASATFDVLGIMNARGTAAMTQVAEMRRYIVEEATPDKLRPGSWARRIYEAADRGEVSADRCPALMRDYLGPSLDTTIFATASIMLLFARHPEQWSILRQNPSLIPNAINEAVRLESPIRGFTRYVTRDHDVGGTPLPSGSRALLLYASANRDERKWDQPDVFDIRRRNSDHVGFGHGVHACAGMNLARLEMHALLKALIKRVERFDAKQPVYALNNVLRGLASLEITVTARAC